MHLSELPVYSVWQVNQYVKQRMDEDQLLAGLLVRGEISNYKKYPSGHHYFSLKDDRGAIRCVLFRGDAFRLRFQPSNGMRVVAYGRVSVFPRDGQYQLYCTELFADGQGDLHAAFEQLKERLAREGLFEQDAKQHKWDCYSCLLHNSCFLRGLSSTRESKNFPYHVYKLNSGCKDSYFFRTCVNRSALLHVYN